MSSITNDMLSILCGWQESIKAIGRIFDTIENCVVSSLNPSYHVFAIPASFLLSFDGSFIDFYSDTVVASVTVAHCNSFCYHSVAHWTSFMG